LSAHPFPPVVRWALFPALAAIAGSIGGVVFLPRFAVMGGAISAGAALASMLTVRRWPSLVAAPVLGIFAACSGMALFLALASGRPPNAWSMLEDLIRQPDALILLSAVPLLQTAVHRIALPRPWPIGLVAGFGAAFIAFWLTLGFVQGGPVGPVAGFLATSTLAQVPAVLAARAVSRRLRPGEST
jgi:hypothetical protein